MPAHRLAQPRVPLKVEPVKTSLALLTSIAVADAAAYGTRRADLRRLIPPVPNRAAVAYVGCVGAARVAASCAARQALAGCFVPPTAAALSLLLLPAGTAQQANTLELPDATMHELQAEAAVMIRMR